mgnify:CR=1 FL=1
MSNSTTIVRVPCEDGAEYDLFYESTKLNAEEAIAFIDNVLDEEWWNDSDDFSEWFNSRLAPEGLTPIGIPTTNNSY